MLDKISKLLELKIRRFTKELELLERNLKERDIKTQWYLKTGKRFNDLINRYPISEDELLSISETVCKFVTITRIVDIDKYLFKDEELERPRFPYELK